jgi:hypothetical protein
MSLDEITVAYRQRVLEIMRKKYERTKSLQAASGASEEELEDAELKMLEAQFELDKASADEKVKTPSAKSRKGR